MGQGLGISGSSSGLKLDFISAGIQLQIGIVVQAVISSGNAISVLLDGANCIHYISVAVGYDHVTGVELY